MTQHAMRDDEVKFAPAAQTPDEIRKAADRNPRLLGLPVDIHVILGGARLSFAELIDLEESSVIRLNAKIDDPVELAIGDRIFARGALIESEGGEGGLSVKITQVFGDEA